MTPEGTGNGTSAKTGIYLIPGTFFLAAAGLFSSLDSVFLWINFIAAGFCYSIAWYRLPKAPQPSPRPKHRQTQRSGSVATIFDTSSQSGSRRVVVFASIFVFGIFFLITFIAIVFSDDSMADDIAFRIKAENYRTERQYDSALFYYRRAMNADPDNLDVVMEYGNSLLDMHQYDSAVYYYEKVMEADQANAEASYRKALARYNQNSYDRAIEESRKTLALDPTFFSAEVIIADSYYSQTNYDSAFRHYTIAHDNDIRSPWVCHVLGYLHQVRGNTDQAIALYEEAISYDSTMTEVYQRLGELVPGEEGDYYRKRGAGSQ